MPVAMADFIHPMQYADDVLSGKQVVCQWVRLAVERHVHDLTHAPDRGFYFDEAAGWKIIIFCHLCKHYKGDFAGEIFDPEPWQLFFLWVLFGWKRRANCKRRFRTALLRIARKNGKTFLGAVIGAYLTCADDEAGAEVYSVATKKDQAKLCHSDAINIIKNSPALAQLFTIKRDNISVESSASKFEPLGRDSNSLDGLNVHGGIMDELHAWRDRMLWDVIDTATGARSQPLLLGITTAGFNRQTICWDLDVYLKKILSGLVDDDEFFGMIYELDNELELDDETAWIKANPNLGVSLEIDELRNKIKMAKATPAQLNSILRLRLDMWTQAEQRWIGPDKWGACDSPIDESSLVGRPCYGGLDLSSTTDISALALVFPPVGSESLYQVLFRLWIPEESIVERSRRDRVPYDAFLREGLVAATPGNTIDYSWIVSQIGQDAEKFDLQEIAFDRWGATKLIQDIQEMGIEVVLFGQGYASMSPPMKELEKLILSKSITHGGHKVVSWMADNVVAVEDQAGNIKPDKSKSIEKIDAIVALIMALDRALHGETHKKGSVYEERGLRGV